MVVLLAESLTNHSDMIAGYMHSANSIVITRLRLLVHGYMSMALVYGYKSMAFVCRTHFDREARLLVNHWRKSKKYIAVLI